MKLGLFLITTSLVATLNALADSASDYQAALAKCTADKTNRDNGYNQTYQKAYDAAQTVLNNQKGVHAAKYNADDQSAQQDRDKAKNDAQQVASSADVAAQNTFNQSAQECEDSAQLRCQKSLDANGLGVANSQADNTYNKTIAVAKADDQQSPDDNSQGDFELAGWQAYAAQQRDLTSSGWTDWLCRDTANTANSNATLSEDCKNHPASCCVDNAGITSNNAELRADTVWINAISPADSSYQYKYNNALATQYQADCQAIATYHKTCGDALAQYCYAKVDALITYLDKYNQINADFNKYADDCVCAYPDDSEAAEDCYAWYQDDADQKISDLYATYCAAISDSGPAAITYSNTLQSAQQTLNSAEAAHAATASAAQTAAQAQRDAITGPADAAVNTAYDLAEDAYYQAIANCSNG